LQDVRNTKWNILKVVLKEYFAFKAFRRLSENQQHTSSIPDGFVASILALGPTFIKLGQILSTRPDLLPKAYISALERLQEDVPPFAFDEVETIVSGELNKPLSEAYSQFDPSPIASASLSQVHFAVLRSGEEVAVKIQRPGLSRIIEKDIATLEQFLFFLGLFHKKLYQNLNIPAVFREFQRYTLQELDFEAEGKTYDRFRANFRGNEKVVFPKVFWSHTTSRVLTMSRVGGLRLQEVKNTIPQQMRRELTNNVIETLIQMFVRDGFFHADLHPGNVFFREDGSLVLIDVGMVGELTTEQKERFILYWLAIVLKEKERAFRHLLQLTRRRADADEPAFFKAYSILLDRFYAATIKEKSLTQTYLEILIMGARYGFLFPPELLLQAKALTTAEHIGYVLVPEFNFAETAKPSVTKALSDRLTLENLSRRFSRSVPEWLLLGETAVPSLLTAGESTNDIWVTGSKHLADRWDALQGGNFDEVRHGEYAVEIQKDVETVFNFVTRFAHYPLWHPIYTQDSHVIHVSGEYIFITPGVIGSVFRLDEIVDGDHLLSNGVVTDFQRNKSFKWKAPFSMLPVVELGTCLSFEPLENGKTKLSEYFFFSESPLKHLFVNRKWFTAEALTHHIREELTGVKNILESGKYCPEVVGYLWEDVDKPVRFINNQAYPIDLPRDV
jgi:predicted unusual protein kinase regulating ubiquinone biosynthesis (AarF/ABC1/UbiB family)